MGKKNPVPPFSLEREMAIELTPTEFKQDFPEFDSLTDEKIQRFINRAELFIDAQNYTLDAEIQKLGIEYLTAHLLSLDGEITTGGGGSVGIAGENIASASIGGVSVSMRQEIASNSFEQWIQSTPYGRLLWALLSANAPVPVFFPGKPNPFGIK